MHSVPAATTTRGPAARYKALSGDRNPTLGTVLRVIGALGLKLRAEAVHDSAASGQGLEKVARATEIRQQ